jgi:hypothetical protein
MVPETKCEVVRAARCKVIKEECVKLVPTCVCRIVQEEVVRHVPVTTCTMVPETICETRCRRVAVKVPVCECECERPGFFHRLFKHGGGCCN